MNNRAVQENVKIDYASFMIGPILNVIIGLICIVGGLTDRLHLIGTDSGILLAGIGAGLLGLGTYRLFKK